MKVLFYKYGSICEPDIGEQFKSFGIDVTSVDVEIKNKKITSAERVTIIENELRKDTYLFVFSLNFFPSISDICNIFSIPYISWTIDSPVLELFSESVKNPCNRIFCFDRIQYTEISHYNPDCIFYLPLGTNVSRWNRVLSSLSKDDYRNYGANISFVGNLYNKADFTSRIDKLSPFSKGYIDGLYECQKNLQGFSLLNKAVPPSLVSELVSVFPDNFDIFKNPVTDLESYIAIHSVIELYFSARERMDYLTELSKAMPVTLFTRSDASELESFRNLCCRPGVGTHTEMPKVFHLSKINLNFTMPSIESGLPLRIWDILGCGGFLLTNYRAELTDYLVPGEDFDYFSDIDELKEKCSFYLAHDDLRQKIAQNGYEKISSFHTYQNRLMTIIKNIIRE